MKLFISIHNHYIGLLYCLVANASFSAGVLFLMKIFSSSIISTKWIWYSIYQRSLLTLSNQFQKRLNWRRLMDKVGVTFWLNKIITIIILILHLCTFVFYQSTTQHNNKITFDANFVFEVISIYEWNMQHYSGTPHSLKDEMFIS